LFHTQTCKKAPGSVSRSFLVLFVADCYRENLDFFLEKPIIMVFLSEMKETRDNIDADENMINSHCYREDPESFHSKSPTVDLEESYSDEENNKEYKAPHNQSDHNSIIDMLGWYTDNFPDNLDERYWTEKSNR
jgi:hypothetical protein